MKFEWLTTSEQAGRRKVRESRVRARQEAKCGRDWSEEGRHAVKQHWIGVCIRKKLDNILATSSRETLDVMHQEPDEAT